MAYTTLQVQQQRGTCFIQLNRPQAKNSINSILIEELLAVFAKTEQEDAIKVLVLTGNDQHFCTGMDFNAVSTRGSEAALAQDKNGYYNLLKHIATCSKVVVAKVDGQVNAGGIGLVTASDIVISSEKATYGLSEALFGLLPACVMPFLIRRVGVQKAQWMSLMTGGISAQRAYEIGLVDEISTKPDDILRRNLLRLTRLETSTIQDLKDYVSKLWIINEATQTLAVDKITSLVQSEKVQYNIKNFVENGQFPWTK